MDKGGSGWKLRLLQAATVVSEDTLRKAQLFPS